MTFTVLDTLGLSALPTVAMVARLGHQFVYCSRTEIRQKMRELQLPRGQRGVICEKVVEEAERQAKIKKRRARLAYSETWLPIFQRLKIATEQAIIEALKRCDYRTPSSKWAGGQVKTEIMFNRRPDCSSRTFKVWSDNGKWSGTDLERIVQVEKDWYRTVYKHPKGPVTRDGLLILARQEGGRIIVMYKGRGFEVYPKIAQE